MGQSAGSNNVQNLIASTSATGLFNKAITLSFNNYFATEMLVAKGLSEAQAEASKKIGQYTIENLRSMSPAEFLSLSYTPTSVVTGTETGTRTLKDAFASGTWNKVNMI